MKGIVNLYKPKGISSSNAVVRARRALGERAIGHMGTLDPAAEGVLLLGVGKATRLFDYFLKKDKEYEAEFTFGFETDTLDSEGKITNKCNKIPLKSEILAVLPEFMGKISQIPPEYSAKSIGGIRAYELARKGISADLKPADIEIYDIRLASENPPAYKFLIHCSSGTYIRSICRDLAQKTQSLATMTALLRTRCGNCNLSDSITLEDLDSLKERALLSVEDALCNLERYNLPIEFRQKLNNGVRIKDINAPQGEFVLYCGGELYGIAQNKAEIRLKTYLRD